MTPDVPTSVAQLDAGWLTEHLGRPVAGVTAEPLGAGASFLGDLHRLTLTVGGAEEPLRLIAKFPTEDPGGRSVGQMLDVWRREHRFYTELADQLTELVPRCHLALADEATDRYLLLVEEISPTRELDQLEGSPHDALAATVEALAVLHARFHDRRGVPRWMPGIGTTTATMLRDAIVGSLDAWAGRYGPVLPDGGEVRLRRFAPDVDRWLATQAEATLTLAHADVRLDNLAFPVGGGVRILDWQTAMVTIGPSDLAILLGTSASVDDRRAWEDGLLERYVARMGSEGVAVDPDVVRRQYAESFLWWSSMFANNLATIDPPTDRGRRLFESMVHRTLVAALDHGV